MARRRKDQADLFSYATLAIASRMTKREIQHLLESGEQLVPPGCRIRTLKRVAVIGAFKAAGLTLFTAARLAKVMLYEFNQNDGEAPSGLNWLAIELARQSPELLPRHAEEKNDYHYHLALSRSPQVYRRGEALTSDAIIEIVDFCTVFMSSRQFPKPNLVGWIDGLGRGGDARVIYVAEILGNIDENPGWLAQSEKLEAKALSERENALAKTIINVSLAIRTALDRVAEYREAETRGTILQTHRTTIQLAASASYGPKGVRPMESNHYLVNWSIGFGRWHREPCSTKDEALARIRMLFDEHGDNLHAELFRDGKGLHGVRALHQWHYRGTPL
jgi:hypothetical protein